MKHLLKFCLGPFCIYCTNDEHVFVNGDTGCHHTFIQKIVWFDSPLDYTGYIRLTCHCGAVSYMNDCTDWNVLCITWNNWAEEHRRSYDCWRY